MKNSNDSGDSQIETSSSCTHEADCPECIEIGNAFISVAAESGSQIVGDEGSLCQIIRMHAGTECSLDFLEHNTHLIPESAKDKKFLFCESCAKTGNKPCYRLYEKNDEGKMVWRLWLGEDDERT